jgi:RNA polymerase sigma factor for flagellar operon FliA
MFAERDLVRQGLPVVQAVAQRIARRIGAGVNIDDLLGIGHLALLEVAKTYDPGRATFAAYAGARLRWAMLDGLRRESHGRSIAARVLAVMASERYGLGADPNSDEPATLEQDQARLRAFLEGQAAALAMGLLAATPEVVVGSSGSDENPEDQLLKAQSVHKARAAVQALPERERELIERHYYGGEQFDAIARDLGISKSWASRLHDRAIEAIGQAVKS